MDEHIDELFGGEPSLSGVIPDSMYDDLVLQYSFHDRALFNQYPIDATHGQPSSSTDEANRSVPFHNTSLLQAPSTGISLSSSVDTPLSPNANTPWSLNSSGSFPPSPAAPTTIPEPGNTAAPPINTPNLRPRVYICGVNGCHQRFTRSERRLRHTRTAHRNVFFCTCIGCSSMERHINFRSRQLLNEHWLSSHPTANHYRCFSCFHSTPNIVHMRRHLTMHISTEDAIDEEMQKIKDEKSDRQRAR